MRPQNAAADVIDAAASYSRRDALRVVPILAALQARGVGVWFDRDIAGGTFWEEAIMRTLRRARTVLFFVSRSSLASDRCFDEISAARSLHKTIIPVVLDHIVFPDDLPDRFALTLQNRATIDARGPADDAVPAVLRALADAGVAGTAATLDEQPNERTNLPLRLPPLIGREQQLPKVLDLIGRHALVTLTGSGGVGKTRLALETGRQMLAGMPDGVWLVELAPLTDPALLASTVASTLGINPGARDNAAEPLVNALRSRRMLLIFDNCEHLIDAAAQLVSELAGACPALSILATSREPLRVPLEQTYRVASLDVPGSDRITAARALEAPTVRLFVDRATAVDPAFTLDDSNASDVARICRRLDGVPLAIEMAAARSPILGTSVVAAKLGERFQLLKAGRRTALPRHQTLRAVYDWGYNLLSASEAAVLRRLGVFATSFSPDAALAVAGASDIEPFQLLDALAALSSKSLVNVEGGASAPRYRLLETTRAYAMEKLADAGETRATSGRLAQHVAALFERSFANRHTLSDAALRDAYAQDLDNLRAALDWALGPEGDSELGLSLASCLEPVLSALALSAEACARLEQAASRITPQTPRPIAARIFGSLGRFYGHAQPAKALAALRQALELQRSLTDPDALASDLSTTGHILAATSEASGEPSALLTEAEHVIAQCKGARTKARFWRARGFLASEAGDVAEGIRMTRLAHKLYMEAGADADANLVLSNLANTIWKSGDLDAAIEACREAVRCHRAARVQNRVLLGFTLANLGGMLTEKGDTADAAVLQSEAIGLLREHERLWVHFDHIALRLAKTGRADLGARCVGFADAGYAANGARRVANERRANKTARALIAQNLSPADFERLRREGAALASSAAAQMALEG